MTKMYALTSTQGTAMSETAICDAHWPKSFEAIRSDAQFIPDWDHLDFTDCSGNDALECQLCGAIADECQIEQCPCKEDASND